jgi:hypothetical protein
LVLLASDFECDLDLPEAARRGNVTALPARLNVGDAYGAGEQAAVDIALYILHRSCGEAPEDGGESKETGAALNAPREVMPPAPELPFVSDHPERRARSLHGTGRCFWDVQTSGDWCADCEVGAEYGQLYLEHLRRTGKPDPLMCWIVADMIATGRWSGVECGFVQTVFEGRRKAGFTAS